MKNLKNNLFGIGLALSVILGVAFAFMAQEANAQLRRKYVEGERIPCNSCATGTTKGDTYVNCATCQPTKGEATGCSGRCRRN